MGGVHALVRPPERGSKVAATCVACCAGVQGKVETDTEVLLVLKTRRALLEQLTAKVVELHPYDEPEVVALPVVGGSTGYLKWVADSVVPPL